MLTDRNMYKHSRTVVIGSRSRVSDAATHMRLPTKVTLERHRRPTRCTQYMVPYNDGNN